MYDDRVSTTVNQETQKYHHINERIMIEEFQGFRAPGSKKQTQLVESLSWLHGVAESRACNNQQGVRNALPLTSSHL